MEFLRRDPGRNFTPLFDRRLINDDELREYFLDVSGTMSLKRKVVPARLFSLLLNKICTVQTAEIRTDERWILYSSEDSRERERSNHFENLKSENNI